MARRILFPRPRHRYLPVGGALLFLTTISVLVLLSRSIAPPVELYVAALVAGGAGVSLLLWQGGKISTRMVLCIAAMGHFIALFGHAAYEDDYFRFIWDGWRLLETGTPYGIAPATFFDDETVPEAMQDVLAWMNYPELPTIYGPVLQILFAVTTFLGGADEAALRLAFAIATLVLVLLMLRRYEPAQVALFAWNPLVVAETTLHLHPDIILALMLFASVQAGRKHPAIAGIFFGLAAGTKIVALAAWPLLLRLRPVALVTALATLAGLYGIFAAQGQGFGFATTEVFATVWYFNPIAFEGLLLAFGPEWGRLAAFMIAGLLVLWLHASASGFDRVPLAAVFGAILLFAPAVNAWYLIWLLPFSVGRREIWPYVASAVLPLSYLTGLNLELHALEEFEVHPLAQSVEWLTIGAALIFDIMRARPDHSGEPPAPTPIDEARISVVIPALDEERSIGATVRGIIEAAPPGLAEVVVADNGSNDSTGAEAETAGARVVSEPERGYGAACLAALAVVDPESNVILFMDADLSDVPEDAASLIAPIVAGEADLVIGSRTLGEIEVGAMSVPQRFGNWLAPALVRLLWRARYTDLGPFRAIRRDALERLVMTDRDFGWTIEMQVRAAKMKMRVAERPVRYRRRIGTSKISGTLRGVILAGWKILYVIAREAFGDFDRASRSEWRRGPKGRPPEVRPA